jgi:hypothetical protein
LTFAFLHFYFAVTGGIPVHLYVLVLVQTSDTMSQ